MQSYFFSFSTKRQYALAAGDAFCLILSVALGIFIRIAFAGRSLDIVGPQITTFFSLIITLHIFMIYVFGQYDLDYIANKAKSTIYITLSVLFTGAISSGILFFFPKYVIGRTVLISHLLSATIFLSIWRITFANWALNNSISKRLAVIGTGEIVSLFIEELSRLKNTGLKLSHLHVPNAGKPLQQTCSEYDFELVNTINELLYHNDFDAVAFDATAEFLSKEQIRHIIECKYRGKAIYDLPLLYQNITGKVLLNLIDGRWLLSNTRFHGEQNIFYTKTKRLLDVVFSIILSLLTLPLAVLISIFIKIDSKGDRKSVV